MSKFSFDDLSGTEVILVVVFAAIVVVIISLVAPFFTIWNAYWVSRIWNELLVPRTGWRPVSIAVLFLIAYAYQILLGYKPVEREHPDEGSLKIWSYLFGQVLGGPLAFYVARLFVGHVGWLQ